MSYLETINITIEPSVSVPAFTGNLVVVAKASDDVTAELDGRLVRVTAASLSEIPSGLSASDVRKDLKLNKAVAGALTASNGLREVHYYAHKASDDIAEVVSRTSGYAYLFSRPNEDTAKPNFTSLISSFLETLNKNKRGVAIDVLNSTSSGTGISDPTVKNDRLAYYHENNPLYIGALVSVNLNRSPNQSWSHRLIENNFAGVPYEKRS